MSLLQRNFARFAQTISLQISGSYDPETGVPTYTNFSLQAMVKRIGKSLPQIGDVVGSRFEVMVLEADLLRIGAPSPPPLTCTLLTASGPLTIKAPPVKLNYRSEALWQMEADF